MVVLFRMPFWNFWMLSRSLEGAAADRALFTIPHSEQLKPQSVACDLTVTLLWRMSVVLFCRLYVPENIWGTLRS